MATAALAVIGIVAFPSAAFAVNRTISGVVSDASGPGVADTTVIVWDAATGDEVDDTMADDDTGAYSVSVPQNHDYTVQFQSTQEYKSQFYNGVDTDDPFDEDVDVVHVGTSNVTGIDALLSYAGDASIAVTVTATAGTPEYFTVTLERFDDDIDDWEWERDIEFDGVGTTTLQHLPEGQYRASAYLGVGYEPVENIPVAFTDLNGSVTIEVHALPTTTLSGTVSGPSGALNNVEVSAARWSGDGWDYLDSSVTTNSSGAYQFTVPQNGDYSLYFSSPSATVNSVYYNGTTDEPVDNAATGVVHVGTTPQVANITLPAAIQVSGKVVKTAGSAALSGATVTIYRWNNADAEWREDDRLVSGSDGKFSTRLIAGNTYTFRAGKPSYSSAYLGGGTSLPATPNATNSRTIGSTALVLPNFSLSVKSSSLGRVAGQKLAYCTAETLDRNDDSYTEDAVHLPFAINFFGQDYNELFVNNNGNVTLTSPRSQFTPSDLTTETERPIIAPFFADVDTRNDESSVVTYGASPDGNTFCVNWVDVGYFDEQADKLNSFQLLLTTRDGVVGRSAGDFDITFNYDEITWETGSASGGHDGFGGTSAAAGFSAGLGTPGTYLQIPGSLVNGTLLDGGPNSLIANKLNSTQNGRYVFEVRNDGSGIAYGSVSGHVENQSGTAVANAYVEAARAGRSYYTQTDASGNFQLPAVSVGDYIIRTTGPGGTFAEDAAATVTAGAHTTVSTIVLREPVGIESDPDVSVGSATGYSGDGVPVVFYGDDIPFRIANQCHDADVVVTLTLGGDTRTITLGEYVNGATSTYSGTMSALYPLHGDGVVTISVTCPSEAPVDHTFDIYVDPSGIVVDQYGNPVSGATVTLLRSTTETGTYAAVPNGSSIMSASNQTNPDTTGADGRFNWDVTPAWYKVKVTKSGSTAVSTAAMQVPPARTELVIKLTVPGAKPPVPTVAPSIDPFTDAVGQTLHVDTGSWGPDITIGTITWKVGSSTKGTGADHVIAAGEVSKLIAVIQGTRTIVGNQEGLEGTPQNFTFPFTYTVGIQKFTKSPAPTISGTPKIGGSLTAKPGTWAPSGATFTYEWYVDGAFQPLFNSSTFKPSVDDYDKKVTVIAIGHKPGWVDKASAESKQTKAVGKGDVIAPKPIIGGIVKVGEELTAVATGWGPAAANPALTYQWYRDGKAIPIVGGDATDGTYELVGLDYGKKITVKVTGTPAPLNADKFVTKSATSSATGKVAIAALTTTATPTITGDPEVGTTLGVDPGTWSPSVDSFKYQWYLGTKAISGATKSTYKVPATALTKTIYVKITSVKLGYTAVSKSSASVTIVKGDFDSPPTPTIVGAAKAGATLSVNVGPWEGTGNKYYYQWYIDDVTLTFEQKPTFKLTDAMFGHEVSVRVWAKNTGYDDSAPSPESVPVIPQHALVVVVPKITGTARVGNTLTATLGTWVDSPSLYVEWIAVKPGVETLLQSGIVGGTSDTYFVLDTASTRGATIKVRVTASKPDYFTEIVNSAPTKKVP